MKIGITEYKWLIIYVLKLLHIEPSHYLFEDFIQQGYLTLQECLKNYDESKAKFSTYAYNYLKRDLKIAICQQSDAAINYPYSEKSYTFYDAASEKRLTLSSDYQYNNNEDESINTLESLYSVDYTEPTEDIYNNLINELGNKTLVEYAFSSYDYFMEDSELNYIKSLVKLYHPKLNFKDFSKVKSYLRMIYKNKALKLIKHNKKYNEHYC